MAPAEATRVPLSGGVSINYRFTSKVDGDLRIDGDDDLLADRRSGLRPGPWTWLRQVHGDRVVVVHRAGDGAGETADAAVTSVAEATLAIHTADCAPVLLFGEISDGAALGVAHAGWRGLEAGVIERTVEEMVAGGATSIRAVLGPCIHAECYEFGAADLDRLRRRFGDGIAAKTKGGAPALDMVAAVSAVVVDLGVMIDTSASNCTGCDDTNFSHRVRRESGRQALVAWIEQTADTDSLVT